MDNTIVHILVIWSKGQDHKDEILADLQKDFEVLKVFNGHWDKDKFLQNYMVFYAHSQYHLDPDSYKRLLQGKVDHCGDEDFTVVILRDTQPHFEIRHTSSGDRQVNTRMFDKKTQYRALTGGGHKIHSSDDAWETNHDLTLMFGRNTEDFVHHYVLDGGEESFAQNCQGVGGYDTIEQLFYVLNNAIRYVVMRNHECIPDQYTVEGHGDIDLLCENRNWMAYLTGAKKIFPEPYRVYHTIRIGGIEVPFDFRFVGDNYYDLPWQEDILNTRVLQKNLFYTPNPEHQFYSLLYHAYIQKWEVKEDYPPKLMMYAGAIGEIFNADSKSAVQQLDQFLHRHDYEYVRPNDKSVVYNPDHIALSNYALRQGQLLKRLCPQPTDGMKFQSRIYEKENSFIKIGTNWLIDNEVKYLERLSGSPCVPRIIRRDYDQERDETILEISRVPGVDYESYFGDADNQTWGKVRSFIIQSIQLLILLADKGISHRDFLPGNLMISSEGNHCSVSLIDFGWATELGKQNENRPNNLAGWFATQGNTTDSNSFAILLTYYWYDLLFVRVLCRMLYAITDTDTQKTDELKKKYGRVLRVATFFFFPYDLWRLFCRRHQRVGWLKAKMIRLFKH